MGVWAIWSGEGGPNDEGKKKEKPEEQPVWGRGVERDGRAVERGMEPGADQREVGRKNDESRDDVSIYFGGQEAGRESVSKPEGSAEKEAEKVWKKRQSGKVGRKANDRGAAWCGREKEPDRRLGNGYSVRKRKSVFADDAGEEKWIRGDRKVGAKNGEGNQPKGHGEVKKAGGKSEDDHGGQRK